MIWAKSVLMVHILIQSLAVILSGLIASLPEQDVFLLTDFTKSELVSFVTTAGFAWQFMAAIIFFVVPPFAYKNQMLDLTILLAYPLLSLYTFLIARIPVSDFVDSPAFWTLAILSIIYYFVSILDVTGPEQKGNKRVHKKVTQ